jgi:peptidyl-prolyl cis-trans isomerase-like protein 2
MPWIKKYGTNPVTGESLTAAQLVKLNFSKGSNGETHCPVTFKVFNENTHIMAVKPTGNVFSYEAIEKLNMKSKNWKDLLTDEPFTRKDLITLQDPHNLRLRNINDFHYLKNDLKLEEGPKEVHYSQVINTEGATGKVLAKLAKSTPSMTPSFNPKPKASFMTAAYSTNASAMSFTSTSLDVKTENKGVSLTEEEYVLQNISKAAKGSLKMRTNFGDLKFELFCGLIPKACYNFFTLAKRGKIRCDLWGRLL